VHVVEMDDEELYVPDDILEEVLRGKKNQNYVIRKNWKNLYNGRSRNGSKE
jgi:hypothetical protein